MKTGSLCICLALFATAFSGEGRLSKEDAQRYAKLCVEQTGSKSSNSQIKTDVDPEKACAVQGEGGGAMVIPDKTLTADKLAKAGKEIVPVGQLWLRKWTLVVDGSPVPEKTLKIAKINIDEKKRPMPLFLLGVRKNGDKGMELLVYAKGNEPLLVMPLKVIDFIPDTPLDLEWTRGEKLVDPLTMKILGKYQAEFAITRTGK
jgi:hypothetical protein